MILFGEDFLIGCNITCMMFSRMPHLQDSIQQLASRSNHRRESTIKLSGKLLPVFFSSAVVPGRKIHIAT